MTCQSEPKCKFYQTAVMRGHYDCLEKMDHIYYKYLITAVEYLDYDFIEWICKRVDISDFKGNRTASGPYPPIADDAAKKNDLKMMKFLNEKGAKCSSLSVERAITNGNFEMFKYVIECDGKGSGYFGEGKTLFGLSVSYGCIDILDYLLNPDNGFKEPEKNDFCDIAAFNGHIHMLEYLRKKNYEWGWRTCNNAAYGDQLEVLKWLRDPETGGGVCQMNSSIFNKCRRNMEITDWLNKNIKFK